MPPDDPPEVRKDRWDEVPPDALRELPEPARKEPDPPTPIPPEDPPEEELPEEEPEDDPEPDPDEEPLDPPEEADPPEAPEDPPELPPEDPIPPEPDPPDEPPLPPIPPPEELPPDELPPDELPPEEPPPLLEPFPPPLLPLSFPPLSLLSFPPPLSLSPLSFAKAAPVPGTDGSRTAGANRNAKAVASETPSRAILIFMRCPRPRAASGPHGSTPQGTLLFHWKRNNPRVQADRSVTTPHWGSGFP